MNRHPWWIRTMGRLCRSAIFGAGFLVAMIGCAAPERVTFDHYSGIQNRISTQQEVRAALGEPDNILGNKWLYERPDRHLTVMIDFDKDGKVDRKQWVDAGGEQWHDTDDAKPK